MRGFPKTIGCKQDLINLQTDFPDQVLERLKLIESEASAKATKVISGSEETNDLITEEIDNPYPMWQRLKFDSLADVQSMIAELESEVNVLDAEK